MRITWLGLGIAACLVLGGTRAEAKAPKPTAAAKALRTTVADTYKGVQADVRAQGAALKKSCKDLARGVASGALAPEDAFGTLMDEVHQYFAACDASIDTAFTGSVNLVSTTAGAAAADDPVRNEAMPGFGGAVDQIQAGDDAARQQCTAGLRTAYSSLAAANACAGFSVSIQFHPPGSRTPAMEAAKGRGGLPEAILALIGAPEVGMVGATCRGDVTIVIRSTSGLEGVFRLFNAKDEQVTVFSTGPQVTVSGLAPGAYRFEYGSGPGADEGTFVVPEWEPANPEPACDASTASAKVGTDPAFQLVLDAGRVRFTRAGDHLTGFVASLVGAGASAGAKAVITGSFSPGLDLAGAAGAEVMLPVAAAQTANALSLTFTDPVDLQVFHVQGTATIRTLAEIDDDGGCFELDVDATVDGRPLDIDATFVSGDCIERTGAASTCILSRGTPAVVTMLPLKGAWDFRVRDDVMGELGAICTDPADATKGQCQYSVSFDTGEGVPTTGTSALYAEVPVPPPQGATGGAIVLVRLPGDQTTRQLTAGTLRFYDLGSLGMPGGFVDLVASGIVNGEMVVLETTLRVADGVAR